MKLRQCVRRMRMRYLGSTQIGALIRMTHTPELVIHLSGLYIWWKWEFRCYVFEAGKCHRFEALHIMQLKDWYHICWRKKTKNTDPFFGVLRIAPILKVMSLRVIWQNLFRALRVKMCPKEAKNVTKGWGLRLSSHNFAAIEAADSTGRGTPS